MAKASSNKNAGDGKDGKGGKDKKTPDPVREAQKAKRRQALQELAKKEPIRFKNKIGFKEAKSMKVVGVDGKPIESWKQFCDAKAVWAKEYWEDAASKPTMSDKALAKKKAAFIKLKERLAKYEEELAGIMEDEK